MPLNSTLSTSVKKSSIKMQISREIINEQFPKIIKYINNLTKEELEKHKTRHFGGRSQIGFKLITTDKDYYFIVKQVDPDNFKDLIILFLDKYSVQTQLNLYSSEKSRGVQSIAKFHTILRNYGYMYITTFDEFWTSDDVRLNTNIKRLKEHLNIKKIVVPKKNNYPKESKKQKVVYEETKKPKKQYWVDKDFFIEQVRISKENDQVTEELGKIFLQMATRFLNSRHWLNVPQNHKEEYVGNAMYNMCKYFRGFNLDKKDKIISYFTQMVEMSFVTTYNQFKFNKGYKKNGIRPNQYDISDFENYFYYKDIDDENDEEDELIYINKNIQSKFYSNETEDYI